MVQIVGLMIGAYSIVRMISLGSGTGAYGETTFLRILCLFNIAFTVILMILLMASGFEIPKIPR